MSCTRRDWLFEAGVMVGCLSCHPLLGAIAAPAKIRVGVQLYSVRREAAKDLPRVLAVIREMGYEGVEFAGYYGHEAKAIRKMLDDTGLVCCGSHTPWESLQADKLPGTIEFNQSLGNKYLICPWLSEKLLSPREKAIETAKLFNDLAAKVKEHGMLVGYHAHGHDFKKLDGETAWEVFFSHTVPDVVMQMDVGNCLAGGGDPYVILEKFPGRSKTIHLKEHGGPPGSVVGEGTVDWGRIFRICETIGGTEWYIVEEESSPDTPMEAIRRSRENLRKMGR